MKRFLYHWNRTEKLNILSNSSACLFTKFINLILIQPKIICVCRLKFVFSLPVKIQFIGFLTISKNSIKFVYAIVSRSRIPIFGFLILYDKYVFDSNFIVPVSAGVFVWKVRDTLNKWGIQCFSIFILCEFKGFKNKRIRKKGILLELPTYIRSTLRVSRKSYVW